MKKNKIFICVLIVFLFINVVFIWGNSINISEESFKKSDSIGEIVKPIVSPIIDPLGEMENVVYQFIIRKSAHIAEFMILGFICTFVKFLSKKVSIFMPLFLTLSVAVIDEFIQMFFGRTSQVADVIIDFTGAAAGIILAIICYKIFCGIKNRKKRKEKTFEIL